MSLIDIGSIVVSDHNRLGYGKLGGIQNNIALVVYFYSVAKQKKKELPINTLKKVTLYQQTRCYVRHNGKWLIGRIGENDGDTYEVNFPDSKSFFVHVSKIYVRCNIPVKDPIEVLIHKGHETAFFHERRAKFVNALVKQRAVTRGLPGLISSKIELYPHQVEIARRVLEDPIQRYLLADEVGLGKTIEAGIILRQFLLDNPNSQVLIIVPPFLKAQWKEELVYRFNLFDFPNVKLMSTNIIDKLKGKLLRLDYLVLDEAHHVAAKAFNVDPIEREKYSVYQSLAHNAKNLLLLSATPVLNNERDFLSMLHLMDPENYKLDEPELFREKIEKRQEIGRLLLSLREGAPAFLVQMNVNKLRELFSTDQYIYKIADVLDDICNSKPFNQEKCDNVVKELRFHVTETYRLHRRMLRNRRDSIEKSILVGRYNDSGTSGQLFWEYDIDDGSEELYRLIEEWREMALIETISKDDEYNQNLKLIFFLLLEAAGSWLGRLNKIVLLRLGQFPIEEVSNHLTSDKFLQDVKMFDGEENILKSIINMLGEESNDCGRFKLLLELLNKYQPTRQKQLAKCVVFSSFTEVCTYISDALSKRFGATAVANHNKNMKPLEAEENLAHFKKPDCWILVCDSSGEEGLNLEFADVLIHFDIPWSPNRLEQRIGRLDRIGRGNPLISHIFLGPECENSMHEAWVDMLNNGFNIFKKSVASLQFYVDDKLPLLMDITFRDGATGLLNEVTIVRDEMEAEQVKINEQFILDEIDILDSQAVDYYEPLYDMESNFIMLQASMEPWLCEALQFTKVPGLKGSFQYRPTNYTLVPLDQLLALSLKLYGTYDRKKALINKEGKLFRIGEEFVDGMEHYVRWDDRGQAFAFWRCHEGWSDEEGMEWIGFRLIYIVEADMKPLRQLMLKSNLQGYDIKALRRRADIFFPPRFEIIHMDTNLNIVTELQLLEILYKPFHRSYEGGFDYNLTKERLPIINDFIDSSVWAETCMNVRKCSEELLRKSQAFQEACNKMGAKAKQTCSDRLAKLKLRIDREENTFVLQRDLDAEIVIADSLVEGVLNPSLRLDSVGLIVVSGRNPFRGNYSD